MIKGLRRKFIIVAMCSVFAVLVLVLSAVNAANYVNVVNNADRVMLPYRRAAGEAACRASRCRPKRNSRCGISPFSSRPTAACAFYG